MKILYAAANREGSYLQLHRFLKSMQHTSHNIKVAAYGIQGSDWNLTALLNMLKPEHISFNNDNLRIYYEQVQNFKPDLIISDLEPFTSYIGLLMNCRVWQVSPELLYYATPLAEKNKLGIYKSYGYIFNQNTRMQHQIQNFILNSERNLIYSHLGDADLISNIMSGFEWARPLFVTNKISKACHHQLVAAIVKNDKSLIDFIKHYQDSVIFTTFLKESYKDIKLKDVMNLTEYGCNVRNSSLFVCAGHADFLADAYYNEKYALILPHFKESECIVNSLYTKQYNLGTIIYNKQAQDFQLPTITMKLNTNIKSLPEMIEEI